ncbi:MAG TPA: serine hydrolase [Candidatus Methylomirabilis sp.]|nr:serine hydrolase [Candidatus Methylomirabilis sp.]
MTAARKRILQGIGVVVVLGVAAAFYFSWQLAVIGAAYKAKILCSGVFVSHRDPRSILTTDLLADDRSVLRHFAAKVSAESQFVTATLWGMAEQRAIYHPDIGCVLMNGASQRPLAFSTGPGRVAGPWPGADRPWPAGERVMTDSPPWGVDAVKLGEAVESAFSEPDPVRLRRTRAVVVVHDGRILAERYAPGFTPATPLLGWSMTKGVINALTGILVSDKKLGVGDHAAVPEWQGPGDPRRNITLDHLLRMTSGLEFEEDYRHPLEDVTFMLLAAPDMAGYAARKPLAAEPGSRWHYSSGNTNIIARLLRGVVGGGDAGYLAFPRRMLFDRIGMRSAVIEPDASGTFVGSSFMYATARDWARFGLLYLQDGMWQGERVLPAGWVGYSRTPTPAAPRGMYGAHFWLRLRPGFRGSDGGASALPADTFHAIGHEGQFVTIIPSRNLVVVRLGLTRLRGAWDHEAFLRRVLEAIPGQP